MICLYFILPQLLLCQKTLWAWGDWDEVKKLQTSLRAIGIFPKLSYIEIEKVEDMLAINFVQKGTNWPTEESFCKQMLTATMMDFIQRYELDLDEDIEMLKVVNIAEPRIAGCRCYVGLFVSLGFTQINGRAILDRKSIDEFCMPENQVLIIAERLDDAKDIVYPRITPKQQIYLALAHSFDE